MTNPADPPPFRHPAVYRTVRGTALSGSRALPGAGRRDGNPALAAPLRVSAVLRVRPASELAAAELLAAPTGFARVEPEPDDADGLFDAAGGRDARRYSEPND